MLRLATASDLARRLDDEPPDRLAADRRAVPNRLEIRPRVASDAMSEAISRLLPMDIASWGAAEWGAFGQVGALVVAVVAGILVWLQVRQGQRVREDQTRPYVVVDFEFRGMLVMLSVSNIGSTPATAVRVSFDKPLQTPTTSLSSERFSLFDSPISMLAPGRRISVYFGMGPDFFKEDTNVPTQYTAQVTYKDLEGRRPYDDPPMVLDLAPFKWSAVDRDDLHDIAQRIKGIEQVMKQWTDARMLNVKTITQADWNSQWDE